MTSRNNRRRFACGCTWTDRSTRDHTRREWTIVSLAACPLHSADVKRLLGRALGAMGEPDDPVAYPPALGVVEIEDPGERQGEP